VTPVISRALFIAVAPALVAGCAGCAHSDAMATFSASYACPQDQITARARPDQHYTAHWYTRPPPADVAADPRRLQLWNAEEARRKTEAEDTNKALQITGCGHDIILFCKPGGSTSTDSFAEVCLPLNCFTNSDCDAPQTCTGKVEFGIGSATVCK
jgi:hypothetical protein